MHGRDLGRNWHSPSGLNWLSVKHEIIVPCSSHRRMKAVRPPVSEFFIGVLKYCSRHEPNWHSSSLGIASLSSIVRTSQEGNRPPDEIPNIGQRIDGQPLLRVLQERDCLSDIAGSRLFGDLRCLIALRHRWCSWKWRWGRRALRWRPWERDLPRWIICSLAKADSSAVESLVFG